MNTGDADTIGERVEETRRALARLEARLAAERRSDCPLTDDGRCNRDADPWSETTCGRCPHRGARAI